MSETPTRLQRLIEERLDGTLADFVAQRRERGAGWRAIATDLTDKTGIEISHQGVRKWYSGADTETDVEAVTR